MAFVKFGSKYNKPIHGNTNRVIINKNYLYIGKDAYEGIGTPKSVDIFYDNEFAAIQLIESKQGRRVYVSKGGYVQVNAKVATVLPIGVYYPTNKNSHTFVLKKDGELQGRGL